MTAAEGFLVIVVVGFSSSVYGANRARLYVAANPETDDGRDIARRMFVQQTLIAAALMLFLVVGAVATSDAAVRSPLLVAVEVVCLFAAPVVLAAMSIIHNVELWRIERRSP